MGVIWFGAAVALGFCAAWMFYPALQLGRAGRRLALVATLAVVGAVPLIVPDDRRFARWLSAVAMIMIWLHLYDLHVGASRGRRPGPRRFALVLVKMLGFVERSGASWARPPARRDRRRLAGCGAAAIVGAVAFAATFRVDWSGLPFLLEHAAKVVAYFLAVVPATNALAASVRLIGGSGPDVMANPFASRTPADFWRRYNRPVNHFFRHDVFVPMGGSRRPIRATLAVFVASAAIHEYVFAVPIGRVQGYQSAFFLVQGLAVAATLGARPTRWHALPWAIGTFAFNVLSGVLFFASLAQVVPFYQRGLPEWLAP